MKRTLAISLVLLCLASGAASAQDETLVAIDAWASATPGPTPTAAVYLVIHNKGAEPRVVTGLTCDRAESVQIHETTLSDGIMQMRPVAPLAVPAGAQVELAPGGMHVMLLGLMSPLVEGEHFTLTLAPEDGAVIEAEVLVGPVGGHAAPEGAMMHGDMDHDDPDLGDPDLGEIDHGDMNHSSGD